MARCCGQWQWPLLTLSRESFLCLLRAARLLHVALLVLCSTMLCVCVEGEGEGYVRALAPSAAPNLLCALLAVAGAAGVATAAAGVAQYSSDYAATPCRLRCLAVQVWVSLLLGAVGAAGALAAVSLVGSGGGVGLAAGVAAAMAHYNEGGAPKALVDTVQLELRCCGAASYEDWFSMHWLNASLQAKPRSKFPQAVRNASAAFVSDDVPFSCCRRDVLMPCIHHGVLSPSPFYRYDPTRELAVWTGGCAGALAAHTVVGARRGVVLLSVFALLQVWSTVLGRLMHTALQSAEHVPALRRLRSQGGDGGGVGKARARARVLRLVAVHAWLLGCPSPPPPPPPLAPLPSLHILDDGDDASLPELGDSDLSELEDLQ